MWHGLKILQRACTFAAVHSSAMIMMDQTEVLAADSAESALYLLSTPKCDVRCASHAKQYNKAEFN